MPVATIGLLCWLIDVGLFILWQPFIYAERKVDFSGLAVIVLLLACGAAWYGWWLLIVWVILDEAVRVIKKMPKWKPGKQQGKEVRVWFTVPVVFKLAQ